MKQTSNVNLPRSLAEQFARDLQTGFFNEPFEYAAISVALETAGPDDGVGVCSYLYDSAGRWTAAEAPGDEQMLILERWVEKTYASVGPWRECIVRVFPVGQQAEADFQFEFDEANSWQDIDDHRLGDALRPGGLPTPIEIGSVDRQGAR